MSRVAMVEGFGHPPHIVLRSAPDPYPGPEQIRVRVRAAGLNPMDWKIASSASTAAAFGLSLPFGLGFDFAGEVDMVGHDVSGYAVGDRVFGSAHSRTAADHLILGMSDAIFRTPPAVEDGVAGTLTVAGLTASAAVTALDLTPSDTVLIGGAAGGVGVLAVQLVQAYGARVLATGAPSTASFLRHLGARPLAYGPGLAQQITSQNLHVTAAIDLHGTDTARAALEVGVSPSRIVTVTAGTSAPRGTHAVGAADAPPLAIDNLADKIAAGTIRVHVAASFALTQVAEALALQATGHVHGKVIVIP